MNTHRAIPRLTIEQINRLLQTEQEHALRMLLILALTMGLRRCELLGLRWQDIDCENQILYVRRIVSGSTERAATETARTIAVPTIALQALDVHRQQQEQERDARGEAWQDLGLVFPGEDGQHLQSHTVWQQYHAVFVAAGLPHLRFHDLRHVTVAFFLERGVSAAVVRAMLGFRVGGTALNILTPVSLSMQQDAMKLWDGLLTM